MITEESIILGILEIESGRIGELVNKPLNVDDTDGGYTNNPDDTGGPTNWGVTSKELVNSFPDTDVRDLTLSKAYGIFKRRYYDKAGAKVIILTHPPLAEAITNFAIHAGHNRAVKKLQFILNLQNNKGKLWDDIVEDGIWGSGTAKAYASYLAKRGETGKRILMSEYLIAIGAFYHDIVNAREKNETFAFGWSKRVFTLQYNYFKSLD